MVEGDGIGGPYRLLVGRQRRFRESARPRVRRLDGRPRRTLQTLFDAGRGRRGEAPQHRGIAWEGGLVERVASARADVKAGARSALAPGNAEILGNAAHTLLDLGRAEETRRCGVSTRRS